MNADLADTHLDVADLIAEATGQVADDRVRDHLASCAHCHAEADRWTLVADGVRALAAAAPQAAPPARPRRSRPRVLAGRRQRIVLAVSAAAALALLGATGYGVTAALSGHAPGTQTGALTAVSGCAGLEQADGTLEQVNGTSLVIATASGQPLTVTMSASTRVSLSGAPLSDITDGASVTVAGPSSDGTIAAGLVVVGGRLTLTLTLPGIVVVRGKAADVSSAGFTVVTSAGTRVPVTTTGSTVAAVFGAPLDQLRAGASTIAVGYAGPGGTLSAVAVFEAIALYHPSPGGQAHTSVTVGNCSPTAIDDAIMALSAG